MYFDRYDITLAYFMYSVLFGHDRYTNGIQRRLAKMRYRPAPSEEYMCGMSPNAKAIFGALVKREQWQCVNYDRMSKRANGRLTDNEVRAIVGLTYAV